MSDRWALALAASVAAGALRPGPVPLLVALAIVGTGFVVAHPAALCLGGAVLASALAQRSLDGLEGVRAGPVEAVVTLLTDPEAGGIGIEAEARLDGRHVVMLVPRSLVGDLREALAGERLEVVGDLTPMVDGTPWARSRHLAGRLTVHRWAPGPPPHPVFAAANTLRRALDRGAEALGDRQASLLAGLVVGDDRAQPVALSDDFRGAGLTHLLAVSGQNVAFVLVLAGPALRRLRLWPRWFVTLAVVAGFGVLTRFEPSVTRAAAMAALAATTTTIGHPIARVRVLALGVAGLVLVDPLLVHSLGFRLSVAAALAIVVGAAPLAAALPGPRPLADAVAVTASAQLGVAPLLLAAFGPLPVAALPANILAVPAAGLAMVWGMTAGVVAGLVPSTVAEALHLPTRLLLGWIEVVASRAAAAPLGRFDATAVGLTAAGLLVVVLVGRARPRCRRVGFGIILGVAFVAVVAAHAPPPLRDPLRPGLVRWHSVGTEVVAVGGGGWRSSLRPADALMALREAGVGAIDVLIVVGADVERSLIEVIAARHPVGALLVPSSLAPGDRPPGSVAVPVEGTTLRVGALEVRLVPGERRLVVEAWPGPG